MVIPIRGTNEDGLQPFRQAYVQHGLLLVGPQRYWGVLWSDTTNVCAGACPPISAIGYRYGR